MRIGILTGGGDVPGLNPCIKAIASRAHENGWEVVGFRRGWAGPLNIDPQNEETIREHVITLDNIAVRNIDRMGGTILHTSRTNPSKVANKDLPGFLSNQNIPKTDKRFDCTDHIMNVLEQLEIGALIAIGGDDTLSYAARLHQEGMNMMRVR